jgi:hypothetical protein
MKKLILLSALLFSFNGWTQVSDEIHQRCKDAADYVGCIQVFTGSIPTTKANDSEADLKKALKLLPRRLENTSLRDFSSAIQPFTDALALAETDDIIADSQLVRDSRKIDYALSVARSAWDTSIEASVEMSSSSPMFTTLARTNSCSVLNREVGAFNASLGGHAMNYPCSSEKGDLMTIIRNENEMISIIRKAALDTADGKALDYPQFISVEEFYQDLRLKKEARENKTKGKKKLSRRQVSKHLKNFVKLGEKLKKEQNTEIWNQMKEIAEESIYSHHSRVEHEVYEKMMMKLNLASLHLYPKTKYGLISNESKKEAIELYKEIINTDIKECDVCSRKVDGSGYSQEWFADNFKQAQRNANLNLENIESGAVERFNKSQEGIE